MAAYPPQNEEETLAYDEALNTARKNKEWADRNEMPLRTWLTEHTEPFNDGSTVRDSRASHNVAYAVNVALSRSTCIDETSERRGRNI